MKQYFSKPIYTKINPAKKTDLLNKISKVASEAILNSPTYPTAIFAEIEEAADNAVCTFPVRYELSSTETNDGRPHTLDLSHDFFEVEMMECSEEEYEKHLQKVFKERSCPIKAMQIKVVSSKKDGDSILFKLNGPCGSIELIESSKALSDLNKSTLRLADENIIDELLRISNYPPVAFYLLLREIHDLLRLEIEV